MVSSLKSGVGEKINKYISNPESFTSIEKLELEATYKELFNRYSCFLNNYDEFYTKILQNKTASNYIEKNNLLKDYNSYDKNKKINELMKTYTYLDVNGVNLISEAQMISPVRTIFHETIHYNHLYDEIFINLLKPEDYKQMNLPIPQIVDEFLNNPDIQKIAGSVSIYSKTSPSEFVAEVGARLIEGQTFSDEVMVLYKKYHGPDFTVS